MVFTLRKISLRKNDIIAFGRLSKFRNWELQIDNTLSCSNSIYFSFCSFKRLFADLVFSCEINLGKFLWGSFVVTDTRIWDSHTDKPVTLDEYKKLSDKREGKPKFKFRAQSKEKWYYSSKFLKLYNLDFLNDPYGITVDLAYFPFSIFTSLQFGNHPRHKFCLSFDIGKTSVGFAGEIEICLFGYFIDFKFGENTLTRNANLKYVEDFQRLIAMGKNSYIENLLEKQIERKNLDYISAIFNSVDIFDYIKFFDKFLILASYKEFFKKDIFDLLIENAKYFNSLNEIENDIDCFEPYAVKKLNDFVNNIKSN